MGIEGYHYRSSWSVTPASTADRANSFLTRSVAPTTQPVSLAEVKRALDVGDLTDFDDELLEMIPAAVEILESDTRRSLMSQTWVLRLDDFPCEIELRRPPVQSVSHIKYYSSGTLTTLSSAAYVVDATTEPGRIVPASGYSWPATDCRPNSIEVTFVAGYSAASLPWSVKQALYLLIRSMREGCQPADAYWNMVDRLRWEGGL